MKLTTIIFILAISTAKAADTSDRFLDRVKSAYLSKDREQIQKLIYCSHSTNELSSEKSTKRELSMLGGHFKIQEVRILSVEDYKKKYKTGMEGYSPNLPIKGFVYLKLSDTKKFKYKITTGCKKGTYTTFSTSDEAMPYGILSGRYYLCGIINK